MECEIVLAVEQDGNHRVDGEGEEEMVGGDQGGGEAPGGQVEDGEGGRVEEERVWGNQTHLEIEN